VARLRPKWPTLRNSASLSRTRRIYKVLSVLGQFLFFVAVTASIILIMDLLQETEQPKPVFVLVPGAWHTASAFDTLVPLLHAANHFTTCVSLPSVGVSPGVKDFSADVLAVRTAVSALVDLGKEVVVVAHSYGGIPVTEALRDLSRSEILKKGAAGGVIRLVYIAAYMVAEGKSCADPVDGIRLEDKTSTACQHALNGVCISIF
jgi:hypothetical protein